MLPVSLGMYFHKLRGTLAGRCKPAASNSLTKGNFLGGEKRAILKPNHLMEVPT